MTLEPGSEALRGPRKREPSSTRTAASCWCGPSAPGRRAGPARSSADDSVPQTVLAELADALVTVHGQADQARLRSPSHQREALDAFVGADHRDALTRYRTAWTERARVDAELAELVDRARDRTREAELLRLGLAEVERVAPQAGEDVALAEEVERLAHAEDLRAAANGAHTSLVGGEVDDASAAVATIDQARRLLEHAVRTIPRWPRSPRGSPRPGTCWPMQRRSSPATWRTCRPTRSGSTPRSAAVRPRHLDPDVRVDRRRGARVGRLRRATAARPRGRRRADRIAAGRAGDAGHGARVPL